MRKVIYIGIERNVNADRNGNEDDRIYSESLFRGFVRKSLVADYRFCEIMNIQKQLKHQRLVL